MNKAQDKRFANLVKQLQLDLPLEPLTRVVNLAAIALGVLRSKSLQVGQIITALPREGLRDSRKKRVQRFRKNPEVEVEVDQEPVARRSLKRLVEGNKRFVAGKPRHPNQGPRRRGQVAQGQHPFAVILGCADSRVPPEVVFDQGLGDLFVIRVAGNIVDDAVLGSIEYAAEHLGTRLIIVLGHAKCGAVAAAVEAAAKGGSPPGHIGSLVKPILPAVDAAKGQPGDPLDNAVRANVGRMVRWLRSSEPVLAALVREGGVKVVGARYDLQSGAVQVIAP